MGSDTMKNKLEQILEEQGRSQIWLANTAKVNRNTISNICREKQTPRIDVAERIAKTLGLTIYDIWDFN